MLVGPHVEGDAVVDGRDNQRSVCGSQLKCGGGADTINLQNGFIFVRLHKVDNSLQGGV